jgi:hypothetical protein
MLHIESLGLGRGSNLTNVQYKAIWKCHNESLCTTIYPNNNGKTFSNVKTTKKKVLDLNKNLKASHILPCFISTFVIINNYYWHIIIKSN